MGTFRMFAPTVVAAIVCAHVAQAQVSEDARRVLNESAAAIGKLESATFSARRYATGPLEDLLNTQGTVKMIRNGPERANTSLRMTGKTKEAGRGMRDFDVLVSNGTITWMDTQSKKIFERTVAPKGEGSSERSIAEQLLMDFLFGNEPYKQVLITNTSDHKVTVEGTEAISGEVCEVVKASFNSGAREIYIHISAKDHLPRKAEWRGNPAKGATNDKPLSLIVEMTDVKANPGLKPADLAMATPDGFTRDVQSAPKSPPTPSDATPAADAVIGLPVGTEAPAFSLKNVKGEETSLASMKGNVSVLTFWGTWNGTWKKAAPTVEKLNTSFAGKPVKMLGIACRESDPKAAADRWTADKMTFPTVIGDEGTPAAYQVKGYPTFVIIGADGKIVDFIQGFPGEELLAARVNASVTRALESAKK